MIITGDDLYQIIKDEAIELGKILVPDDIDIPILNSIINYAKRQDKDWEHILTFSVHIFIRNCKFTFTIKDLANMLPDIFTKVRQEQESAKEFEKLVKETKERMEKN